MDYAWLFAYLRFAVATGSAATPDWRNDWHVSPRAGSRTDIACGLRNRLAAADGLDRCRRPGEGYPMRGTRSVEFHV